MSFSIEATLFFLGGFVLTLFSIPKIISLVEYKNLMDDPTSRSSHLKTTPTLGGIAFFIALILSLFFLKDWSLSNDNIYLIPGLTILFITGLKDDLLVLSPTTKILTQLISIFFVLANETYVIQSLNGFFEIQEIPLFFYYTIGCVVMLVIINAFNLIDGIDGLASIVGIVILTAYSLIFYYSNENFYVLLCLTLIGCLIAFLRFNLSSNKKIFMGDTGSIILGFIISVLSLRFMALPVESYNNLPFQPENTPLIAICILFVPLFDIARIFVLRLVNKKNPFSPDRNHTHHVLVDYFKISHCQLSFIIGGFNLVFIYLIIFFCAENNFCITILLAITILTLLYFLYKLKLSYSIPKKNKGT
jgi:UDP-N-acetylmuramyl pentapeptide phosphotransferase/UDP-N-acetylglucosamine-1-phosphate transferase